MMMLNQKTSFEQYVLGMVLALSLCNCELGKHQIPAQRMNATAENWSSQNGQLFWSGQPFSGYRYALYSPRDTAEMIPFWHGKEEGVARYWHPNGRLREKRFFKQGKREGTHYGWWEDGKPSFVYHFKADLHQGLAHTWHSNGKSASIFNYTQGQEDGQQQAWYDNGVLRLNYVARNGRQYGLTGVKNCATVWDATVGEFKEKPE